ncbi:hypothetical protein BP6252_10954 [Coleophoma cylindrospora]|uniref:Uncharacterized protein n=1 Tax=Coleophoma cylindrospora TaxID=1849047 RepID=A0A3D8QNP8_9HELO|nr:hypothetical protein BP6252_10954 [Coleophoma cylindrospora]
MRIFPKRMARKKIYWHPISLRLPFLTLFGLVVLCLLLALLLLRREAVKHRGFRLITSNHYTWTYGPTAVLTILTSLWRLVDYHCKALMPWSELANGPVDADRSLLLDHLSPFLLVTVIQAIKYKHLVVILTIFGFLLFKLITVASTGLFFPTTITVGPLDVEMTKIMRFDNISVFNHTNDPGPSPFYTAYAVMERGVLRPEGVAVNMLYEAIRPTIEMGSPNTTYRGNTSAFVPQAKCSHVQAKAVVDYSQFTKTVVYNRSPIQLSNDSVWTCPRIPTIQVDLLPVAAEICPPRQIMTVFGVQECNNTSGNGASPLLVALLDARYSQSFNVSLGNYSVGDVLAPEEWAFEIPMTQAMLCQISYEMKTVQITYNMSKASPVIEVEPLSEPSTKLNNVADDYLTGLLTYASPGMMGGARDMFGLAMNFENVEQPPVTITEMMAAHAGGDYEYLLNHPDEMLQAAEEVLTQMLLFVGKEGLLFATNNTFRGDVLLGQKTYTEKRLQIQQESLFVMLGGFSVVLLLTISVALLRPKTECSANPEAIIAVAKTLRRSSDVNQEMTRISDLSESDASADLRRHKYCTHIDGSIHQISSMESSSTKKTKNRSFWSPWMLKTPALVLTLASALLIIAVLEILQHLSDSSSGIVSLDVESFTLSLYTRFLPALVMLLLATLFNGVDFNVAVLAPFSKMYAGTASSQSLIRPLVGQLPPLALYNALRNRYWSAYLTGLATMVASVLTIVVSGLYSVEYVPSSTPSTLYPMDSWNLSYSQGLSTDNATAAVASLVESGILSYPAFTFDELVFSNLEAALPSAEGNVTAKVPGLRAELSCTELSSDIFNFTVGYVAHYEATMVSILGTVPLPENCQRGSRNGNMSYIPYANTGLLLYTATNTTYIGSYVDLHVGPFEFVRGMDYGASYPGQPDNPPECPSVLLIYGFFDGWNKTRSAMTVQSCYQRLQKIDVDVVLSGSGMTIQHAVPNESTAEYLPNGQANNYEWRLQPGLDFSFQSLNRTKIDPYLLDNDLNSAHVSNFFRGALFGRTPLALEALAAGSPDIPYTREQVFEHIQKFYRRYMAQYISANMRVPKGTKKRAINDAGGIQGSFTPDIGVPRMVQNRTPKLILQILLAVMFVCGTFACLGKNHKLVLWNPCSIAGVMVLFAGSKMCSLSFDWGNITSRSDMTNDMELRLLAGSDTRDQIAPGEPQELDLKAKFRLGWWKDVCYIGQNPQTKETGKNSGLRNGKDGERYGIDICLES